MEPEGHQTSQVELMERWPALRWLAGRARCMASSFFLEALDFGSGCSVGSSGFGSACVICVNLRFELLIGLLGFSSRMTITVSAVGGWNRCLRCPKMADQCAPEAEWTTNTAKATSTMAGSSWFIRNTGCPVVQRMRFHSWSKRIEERWSLNSESALARLACPEWTLDGQRLYRGRLKH